jgi:hypothetical protein
MAGQLARQEQEFADRANEEAQKAGGGEKPPTDASQSEGGGKQQPDKNEQPRGLGGMARELVEKSKTLTDVLGAASKAASPEDQKSAEEVARIMQSLGLAGVAERLGQLPSQVRNGKLQEARATAGDGAERMEAAAEQFAILHRTIVAPKVEELAKLEEKLVQLDNQLEKLDTDPRITVWHQEASDALEKLDEAGIDKELRLEFQDEMKKAGWDMGTLRGNWNWGRSVGGYYAPPARYRMLLSRLEDSLRSRMQEYLLGEMRATGEEPIPPQYQDLVDRYYRVLSSEGRSK